jgi:dienelactone hydrolase
VAFAYNRAMRTLARSVAALAAVVTVAGVGIMNAARAQDAAPLWQVRHAGDGFDDGRVAAGRDLDHPATFTPAFATRAEWMARAETLRRQVRVALGLWPWPERTPLNATIRGKIDRDGYTIEQVAFESVPGHWVTGNLYRPKGRTGRVPAVLAPHGHWPGGRHQERSLDEAKKELASGGEQYLDSARYALQARPAMLARMGVIAFAWDMVGYADSTAIAHRAGFTDAEAELRLQSFLGLSMWNEVRAVDFLLTLPDVDPARIGVNGASGGGTQSLLLAAIDDRIATAVPAVMVGGNMQGGCICENAGLLRLGTNNIEITALAAPKPLAAVAANDWTSDFMTKGLPELKAIYALMGAPDAVAGQKFEFAHNDNQVSREYAYGFFNTVFELGLPEPVRERPFVPVPPAELKVFDAAHPRPASERDAAGVRQAMRESSARQLQAMVRTPSALTDVIRGGFETALFDRLPAAATPVEGSFRSLKGSGFAVHQSVMTRPGSAARVPAIGIVPDGWKAGPIVVWVHERGKQGAFEADGRTPSPEVKRLLAGGAAVLAPDVFLTGEAGAIAGRIKIKNEDTYFGYQTGYNRTVFAERVSDVLTAIAFAKNLGGNSINVAGRGKAGAWVLAARALAGDVVARASVDLGGFEFDQVRETTDESRPGLAGGGRPHHHRGCTGRTDRGLAAPAGQRGVDRVAGVGRGPGRCRAEALRRPRHGRIGFAAVLGSQQGLRRHRGGQPLTVGMITPANQNSPAASARSTMVPTTFAVVECGTPG